MFRNQSALIVTVNIKSKKCDKYLREYGIQKIKVIDRLSYVESKRKFNALYPATSQSSFSKPIQSNPAQAQSYKSTESDPLNSLTHSHSQQACSSHTSIAKETSNTHTNNIENIPIINQITVPKENTETTNTNVKNQNNNTIDTITHKKKSNPPNTPQITKQEQNPYNTRLSKGFSHSKTLLSLIFYHYQKTTMTNLCPNKINFSVYFFIDCLISCPYHNELKYYSAMELQRLLCT